ncbi:hypothetical protein SAMN04488513_102710 [Pseudozobellia thermophila]|uniref:Uncharacterized protein n=1 Tax=Pseudozobellia thermophila TaxID=192903 RepID=A0A1M6G7L8_9FLAO|nr:hypothetical protein SAMN04488513_102710 [Pseudozobellia thermophila]
MEVNYGPRAHGDRLSNFALYIKSLVDDKAACRLYIGVCSAWDIGRGILYKKSAKYVKVYTYGIFLSMGNRCLNFTYGSK